MSGKASSWVGVLLSSSIGKKQIMAITGLALSGFLIVHLLGNFLIFVSPDAFNMYSYKLTSNPLIYIAEAGLASLFLVHIGMAIRLIAENRRARPVQYYSKVKTGRGSTFASSTMPITGTIGAVFLITHIINFKIETLKANPPMTIVDGIDMINIYQIVIDYFTGNPLGLLFYVISVTALAIHLSHGFQSAFQSLGFNHPKYTPGLQKLSLGLALFIGFGFASIPVWAFITGGVQ